MEPTDEIVEPSKTQPEKRTKPWDGKAERTDKVLLTLFFAFPLLFLALRPFHPFLLADYPILLAAVTGSNSAIGASAAFAKVEGTSLFWPLVAGTFGSVKLTWLFWWAGRRWGLGIVELVTPSEGLKRRLKAAQQKHWLGRLGVIVADLPGVPGVILYLFAGWQRMGLALFMMLATLGSFIWVSIVTAIGYALGQRGVDLVLLVDKYAIWVSVAIVIGLALLPSLKAKVKGKQ